MNLDQLDLFWGFYNNLIKNSALSYSLTIAKAVTCLLLVIQGARLYFSSYKVNMQEHSPTYYELFRPFFLITAIVSYSYILDTFDSIAVESEKYVYSSFKVESSVEKDLAGYRPGGETDTNKKEGETLLGSVTEDISAIKTFIQHPTLLLVKAFDFFISLMDALAYTFVIIVRFAFLFILRFLGPFALAFSIYHRFENWWVNWIKAYGMLYLWVMVIFLINFFATGIAHGVYKVSYAMGQGERMAFMAYNSALWCLVLVKLYLYFKSKKMLHKIFA